MGRSNKMPAMPSAAAAAAAFASGHLTHDMTPLPRPAQDSADGANFGDAPSREKELPAYRLVVEVDAGRAHTLELSSGDDLAKRVWDFVAQHRMKEVFEGPLLERAQSMLSSQQREDRVDIC